MVPAMNTTNTTATKAGLLRRAFIRPPRVNRESPQKYAWRKILGDRVNFRFELKNAVDPTTRRQRRCDEQKIGDRIVRFTDTADLLLSVSKNECMFFPLRVRKSVLPCEHVLLHTTQRRTLPSKRPLPPIANVANITVNYGRLSRV